MKKLQTSSKYKEQVNHDFIVSSRRRFEDKLFKTQDRLRKLSTEMQKMVEENKFHNQARFERAKNNMRSQVIEYRDKVEKTLDKHHRIDEKVASIQQKIEKDIALKSEISQIKQEQLNRYKLHIKRKEDNKKLKILLKESIFSEKIKKANQMQAKMQKAQNELRIKSLTYR